MQIVYFYLKINIITNTNYYINIITNLLIMISNDIILFINNDLMLGIKILLYNVCQIFYSLNIIFKRKSLAYVKVFNKIYSK